MDNGKKRGLMAPQPAAEIAALDFAHQMAAWKRAVDAIDATSLDAPDYDAKMAGLRATEDRIARGTIGLPVSTHSAIADKVRLLSRLLVSHEGDLADRETQHRIAEAGRTAAPGTEADTASMLLALYLDLTSKPVDPNADLIAEAEAILELERRAADSTEDLWDMGWDERMAATLSAIDQLPATPANLEAKVMGLRLIYENNGDFDEWESGTTDNRLARDIFKAMMIQRSWARPDWFGVNHWLRQVREASNCDVFAAADGAGFVAHYEEAKGNWRPPNRAAAAAMWEALPAHRKALVAAEVRRRAEAAQ